MKPEIYVVNLNGSIYRIVSPAAVRGGDFDGDGKIDITVYRPSTGGWYILRSSTSTLSTFTWGVSTDIPVGRRLRRRWERPISPCFGPVPAPGTSWRSPRSSQRSSWGGAGDIPVPGDYDGDGKTDIAVFRLHGHGTSSVPGSRTRRMGRAGSTSRSPVTTTATARPTSPSTAPPPASGSSSTPPLPPSQKSSGAPWRYPGRR